VTPGQGAGPARAPRMTDRPLTCAVPTLLPLTLVSAALSMARTPDSVTETVYCDRAAHQAGLHYGLIAEADATHAVWALWEPRGTPHLRVLPDCPEISPDRMDGCSLYARHRGAHTWQAHDPEDGPAGSKVAALPTR